MLLVTLSKRPMTATSSLPMSADCQELAALKAALSEFAGGLGVDLNDRRSLRALISGDWSELSLARSECEKLRTMLVLLYRLEDSSSEDIGIQGLQHLWRQHGEIIAAHAGMQS